MRSDRLLPLATHLRSGNLGAPDFRLQHTQLGCQGCVLVAQWCGSKGCALGEMPFVDPEAWEFRWSDSYQGYLPLLRSSNGRSEWSFMDAAAYFEITEEDADYLFAPDEHEIGATAEQVAQKIEAFVEAQQQTVAVPLEPLLVDKPCPMYGSLHCPVTIECEHGYERLPDL